MKYELVLTKEGEKAIEEYDKIMETLDVLENLPENEESITALKHVKYYKSTIDDMNGSKIRAELGFLIQCDMDNFDFDDPKYSTMTIDIVRNIWKQNWVTRINKVEVKDMTQQELDTIEDKRRFNNGEIDKNGEFTKKGWKIHG